MVWDPEGQKHTSNYIDDPDWKRKITAAGEAAVERLKRHDWNPDAWNILLEEADRFALESGLLDENARANLFSTIIDNSDETMSCHLCMLGTSLIVVPRDLKVEFDTSALAQKLRAFRFRSKRNYSSVGLFNGSKSRGPQSSKTVPGMYTLSQKPCLKTNAPWPHDST